MRRGQWLWSRPARTLALLGLLVTACAPAAAPAPTAAPQKPAATQAPAAKPAAAESPAAAKPAAAESPAAAKPGATSPAPAAKPAEKAAPASQVDLAAAKAEGKAVGYGVLIDSQWKALNDVFQKKVGIPVENFRGPTNNVVSRVETEKAANQHLFDIVVVESQYLDPFAERNYIQKLPADVISRVPDKWRDPKGYWAIFTLFPITVIYNTQLVPESNAPKALEDLLDPRWKGKIAMTDPILNETFLRWFFVIRKQMGEDKARQFLTGLAAQNPTMFESGNTVSTNINQGQFPLGIGFMTHVLSVGGPGGQMNYMKMNPMLSGNGAFALANNPPHPAAARAMADVFFSQEYLQLSGDLGYPITLPGVKSAIPGADTLTYESLPELTPPQFEEMRSYLKAIFNR